MRAKVKYAAIGLLGALAFLLATPLAAWSSSALTQVTIYKIRDDDRLLVGMMKYVEPDFSSHNNTYGGMFNFTEGGWTMSITTTGIYYNVSGLVPGLLNGMAVEQLNETQGGTRLIVQKAGVYHITAVMSLKGGNAGEYGLGISQNYNNPESSEKASKCYSRFTGTNQFQTTAVTCLRRLETGDRISMIIDDEANPAQNAVIEAVNVNMEWLGT